MLPQDILQALYDSEINCRIEIFWEGGWTAWLGDDMNGFRWPRYEAGHLTNAL